MPPPRAGQREWDPQEAAAIRHAARRAMFGGFKGEDGSRVELNVDEDAEALVEAARLLAAKTLADPPPRNASRQQSANPPPDDEGVGLNPWLPRLGAVHSVAEALGLRSFYSKWIVADLSVWGADGISKVRELLAVLRNTPYTSGTPGTYIQMSLCSLMGVQCGDGRADVQTQIAAHIL